MPINVSQKLKSIAIGLLCWSSAAPVFAEAPAWKTAHEPPSVAEKGKDLELSFSIEPADKVSYAVIYARSQPKDKFKSKIVRGGATGGYRGVIAAENIQGAELEYFIRIVDTDGANHDVYGSAREPVKVAIVEPPPAAMDLGAGAQTEAMPDLLQGIDLSGLDDLAAEFQLLQVEDVVVSASKQVQSVAEAPAAVHVFTRDDVRAFGFRSPAELLRYAPGMQVYRINEATPLVGVRGFADESNNLVLMLEQGRELNVELFGAPFLENQAFHLDDIERIEVIRGPGSALYGANAFSGIVNFIPKRPSSYSHRYGLEADVETVQGGQHLRLRASGVTDVGEYGASGHYREERSSSGRKDRALRTIAARTGLIFSAGEIPFELDAGVAALEGEQYSILGETTADMLSGNFTARSQLGPIRAILYYNHWDAELGIADPTLAPILPQLIWDTDTINLDLSWDFEAGDVYKTSIGLNGRWNRYESQQMSDPVSSEARTGIFWHNEIQPVDKLIINASVRSDFSSLYLPGAALTDRLTLSPRLVLIVPVNEAHGLRAGVGRAFRKPSFFESQMQIEAFAPLGLNFANANLKNEQVTGIDAGYTGKTDTLRWSADLFYNIYRDFIEFDPGTVKFANEGRDSNSYGGELALRYRIRPDLQAFSNYSYLSVIVIREAPLVGAGATEEIAGDSDPSHMANVGLRYTPSSGFIAAAAMHWQSERVWRILNPNKGSLLFAFNETQRIPAYVNLFAKLGYSFSHWELGVIGEQLQWDRHKEFPGLDDIQSPDGLAPTATGKRYGGENLSPRVYAYVEGRF